MRWPVRDDTDTLGEIEADSEQLVVSVEGLEFHTMLDGDDDAKDIAILVIHSGAGGTEAADWAEMLMRMYTRWTERNDMQSSIMDMQPGEEAGVKGHDRSKRRLRLWLFKSRGRSASIGSYLAL